MSLGIQNGYLDKVNSIFDNLSLNKDFVDESQREKFVSRAISLKNVGMDITEESKITGSFFREFSNVSTTNSSPTHEERLMSLSERYTEMRNELGETFKDNEDEYYHQMEKLNTAFKGALDSTCLTPIYSFKTTDGKLYGFTEEQENERIHFEKEAIKTYAEYEKYNKNVQSVMKNFQKNLLKHVDTFYESFINSIQMNKFDTAYQETMSSLKSHKTTSYNEISYSDMINIMDVINNVPIKFDEHGTPTKMRYNSAEQSFKELIKNDSIPKSVKKVISIIFNY